MISENSITRNEELALESHPLTPEMAVINEWIVREDLHPDVLLRVYVKPLADGTIAAACSCDRGARDEPCHHALKVITEIKEQPWLLKKLFAPRTDSVSAA